MRATLAAAILAVAGTPAFAHRLDQYLQGAIVSVEKSRMQAQITLTPGIAVFPLVIASIDTDGDGAISEAEQRAYAGRVLQDLSLTIDGYRLTPELLSIRFPTMDEMREGRGEIELEFSAALPRGRRSRKLTFENHHQSPIAAYQVNCLVPRDPDIRIAKQVRNYSQSRYELDYVQADGGSDTVSLAWGSGYGGWLATGAVLVCGLLAFLWRRASSASAQNIVFAKYTDPEVR